MGRGGSDGTTAGSYAPTFYLLIAITLVAMPPLAAAARKVRVVAARQAGVTP